MDLQFKSIEVDTIKEILPFYNMRHNNTCDSVFLESFIWKEYYNVRYAIWEEKALLWLMESNGKCFSAMPLCREEDLPDAFKAIERYFNETLGFPLVINLADEYAIKYLNLPENEYLVEEQVDSRDYLYTGDAMRTLAGKKLHKKKNRVNAFKREYEGRYEFRRLCCSDSHEVWEFLDKWRLQKGDDVEEHLDYEVRGIHDILKNCSDLYVRMGGVYIDGALEAFTIGSYNPVENMAVIHIEKANPEINGLYQYINQEFLIEEFPTVDWVNREDDMGLEGLRKAKSSYNPADYARKYLVEQLLDGSHGYHWAEEIGNTVSGSRFEYLENEDKNETSHLWHTCFPEDSEAFVQYYYQEKVKDNRVLVKNDSGMIVSMVHLTPYQMRMKEQDKDMFYLAGVGTELTRRREGHFADVFRKVLQDMRAEGLPFAYLVPVDPAIYAPMGFTYIGDLPSVELTEEARNRLTSVICRDEPEDCSKAASYMETWLSQRYEMYCRRSEAYVSRLIKELASENGALEFLYDGEGLVGLQAYWGLAEREQRLLYAEEPFVINTGSKPWNMARVTNLEALLTSFKLKEGESITLELEVEDPIIEENSGRFTWSLTQNGSELKRNFCNETKLELTAKTEELISWLTGYKAPEKIWPQADIVLLERLKRVDTVNGVFLDELV